MRFTILKSGASYTVVDCHTYRAIRQCRRLFSDGHDNLDLARWQRLKCHLYDMKVSV